jgi:hypothetical protein
MTEQELIIAHFANQLGRIIIDWSRKKAISTLTGDPSDVSEETLAYFKQQAEIAETAFLNVIAMTLCPDATYANGECIAP